MMSQFSCTTNRCAVQKPLELHSEQNKSASLGKLQTAGLAAGALALACIAIGASTSDMRADFMMEVRHDQDRCNDLINGLKDDGIFSQFKAKLATDDKYFHISHPITASTFTAVQSKINEPNPLSLIRKVYDFVLQNPTVSDCAKDAFQQLSDYTLDNYGSELLAGEAVALMEDNSKVNKNDSSTVYRIGEVLINHINQAATLQQDSKAQNSLFDLLSSYIHYDSEKASKLIHQAQAQPFCRQGSICAQKLQKLVSYMN